MNAKKFRIKHARLKVSYLGSTVVRVRLYIVGALIDSTVCEEDVCIASNVASYPTLALFTATYVYLLFLALHIQVGWAGETGRSIADWLLKKGSRVGGSITPQVQPYQSHSSRQSLTEPWNDMSSSPQRHSTHSYSQLII
jgi:hypothetical protein